MTRNHILDHTSGRSCRSSLTGVSDLDDFLRSVFQGVPEATRSAVPADWDAPIQDPRPAADREVRLIPGKPSADLPLGTTWFSVAYPTGDRSTSDLALEQLVPNDAPVGVPFDGALRLINLSDRELLDVEVDLLPAVEFTIMESEPESIGFDRGQRTWRFESLAPRQVAVVRFTAAITGSGALRHFASVSYRFADADPVSDPANEAKHGADTEIVHGLVARRTAGGSSRSGPREQSVTRQDVAGRDSGIASESVPGLGASSTSPRPGTKMSASSGQASHSAPKRPETQHAAPSTGPARRVPGTTRGSAIPGNSAVPKLAVRVIEIAGDEGATVRSFRITVRNNGKVPCKHVAVRCRLGENLKYVQSSGHTPGMVRGGQMEFTAIAVLGPGEEATWQVSGKPIKPGKSFVVAEVSMPRRRPLQESCAVYVGVEEVWGERVCRAPVLPGQSVRARRATSNGRVRRPWELPDQDNSRRTGHPPSSPKTTRQYRRDGESGGGPLAAG